MIQRKGPWRHLEAVEFATLTWVDWFKMRRLPEPIGYVPPAEYEADYYKHLNGRAMVEDGGDLGIRQPASSDDRHAGASCEVELAPTDAQSSPSVLGSRREGARGGTPLRARTWKTYDSVHYRRSIGR